MNVDTGIVLAPVFYSQPLAAIHAEAFPPAERWTAAAIAGLLAAPASFGLLHPAGGMLLGRVVIDEAEVLTVAVAPAARRRGIGSALVRHAAQEGRRLGARSLFLEVSAANAAAWRLYRAAGFAEIGRRRRYYPGGVDGLVMKLMLPDHAEDEAG